VDITRWGESYLTRCFFSFETCACLLLLVEFSPLGVCDGRGVTVYGRVIALAGLYCPVNASFPVVCPSGSYCPVAATAPTLCPMTTPLSNVASANVAACQAYGTYFVKFYH
jgi:hypothetical protein